VQDQPKTASTSCCIGRWRCCLRHTFASHLAMRSAPPKAIQELLGHATIQMTMRYAHLAPAVARDAVRLLDANETRGKTVPKTEEKAAI
jgi:integrase